jgi:putative membrane protein
VDAKIPDDKKATEHLANERTFLAWVRTSVSIMSLGFVVAKFGVWLRELATRFVGRAPNPHSGLSAPVGAAIIGFGGLMAVLAAWRFRTVNREIEAGRVIVDRGLVMLITVVVAALAVVMMAYIVMTGNEWP